MKRYLSVAAFILAFLSVFLIFTEVSWGKEEGILDPLCGPCKKVFKEVLELMQEPPSCLAVDAAFDGICELVAGEDDPVMAVYCVAGGVAAGKVCDEMGGPHKMLLDPGGAAKKICKKVALCYKL